MTLEHRILHGEPEVSAVTRALSDYQAWKEIDGFRNPTDKRDAYSKVLSHARHVMGEVVRIAIENEL